MVLIILFNFGIDIHKTFLPSDFLYDIVWNSEQNIVNKLLVQGNTFPYEEVQVTNERATRKRLLAQGYFLSLAQGSNFEAQRIKRLSEKCFPGEIKLL